MKAELKKPIMILFDYGHTLIGEPGFDLLHGTEAVMRYAAKNPQRLTPLQVREFADKVYAETFEKTREVGIDLHYDAFDRLVYEYLQIEFPLSGGELEQVFLDNAGPGVVMPHTAEMLTYLHERGIRTGVISNNSNSGETLKARFDLLLPNNQFEFVISSSDYMYRKPNPMLFELALRKANLSADEVWFCGDSPNADIAGAAGVGMFPVWYENLTMENPWREKNAIKPTGEHLHIHDWRELIEMLETLH